MGKERDGPGGRHMDRKKEEREKEDRNKKSCWRKKKKVARRKAEIKRKRQSVGRADQQQCPGATVRSSSGAVWEPFLGYCWGCFLTAGA